jgi:hypothetical protein
MAVEIITREDLQLFKQQLIAEIKEIVASRPTESGNKKWLRNSEVRSLLSISMGTLQNLRTNGTLKFRRIGSIYYYSQEDIDKLLSIGKR